MAPCRGENSIFSPEIQTNKHRLLTNAGLGFWALGGVDPAPTRFAAGPKWGINQIPFKGHFAVYDLEKVYTLKLRNLMQREYQDNKRRGPWVSFITTCRYPRSLERD